MKRRIIAILVTLTLACATTACSKSGTITSSTTASVEVKGNYSLYYTDSNEEYLNFIEMFDHEKYEIFDISHCRYYWYVTYKLKN